jgi:EAL domain-containing protein (putative c-di-GMP-specific phosphodiesterase class I)
MNGESIRPSVSIGLAPIDRNSGNAAAVLADARSACSLAKERGRNCFITLNEVDTEVKKRRQEMEWTTRITLAMEQDRLFLVWQRIEPVRSRAAPPHYEILIRLRDENGETVGPGSFLPAVEKHGMSARLDSWVIGKALDWLHDHPDTLMALGLCSINLSGDSVGDSRVRELVLRRIRELAFPAGKLCFEITETAAVNNFNEARRFILALKELGCRFAIDDFGSGVSSFGYLKHLPVDFLKIDGSFIRHIVEDELDSVLVRSMNDVSHAMGKQTVAEFVENEAILKKLRRLGVDYAQGYAIGRPEPMAD